VILRTEKDAAYYQFPHLTAFAEIQHGIFPREPGCSGPPFHGLNVSYSVGDDPQRVEANRQRIARCMQADQLVFAAQVHGTAVVVIDGLLPPEVGARKAGAFVGDALVTDRPGAFLAISVADCQAILICDPRRRVVANVHVGWRGSVAGLVGRTLAVMGERFGCDPADLHAGIGPSLGPCCAEFKNYRQEIPVELWSYRRDSVRFDFWAMSRDQLMAAGVPAEQIAVSGVCTKCRKDIFFSYRAEKTTGRFAAVIGLRQG
jgi:YfiH family protein